MPNLSFLLWGLLFSISSSFKLFNFIINRHNLYEFRSSELRNTIDDQNRHHYFGWRYSSHYQRRWNYPTLLHSHQHHKAEVSLSDVNKEVRVELVNNATLSKKKRNLIVDFEMVRDGLLMYKQLYGSLDVPRYFAIGMNDSRFPEAMRGLDLGSRLEQITDLNSFRSFRRELLDIGVAFTFTPVPFAIFKTALLQYKEIHGVVQVGRNFIISEDDVRYPKEMRGRNFSKYIDSIRTGHIYQEYMGEIEAMMGDDLYKQFPDFHLLKYALSIYQKQYGNLSIPLHYVIPLQDMHYPEAARGLQLGYHVDSIRHRAFHSAHTSELIAMGFQFDQYSGDDFVSVQKALFAYKKIYGHVAVPLDYKITPYDTSYPSECCGMMLGRIVDKIRYAQHFANYKNELLAMEFDFDEEKIPFDIMKETLRVFKSIYGHINVSQYYFIHYNDLRYPQQVRGKTIGQRIMRIRMLDEYCEYRQELLELEGQQQGNASTTTASSFFVFQPKPFHLFQIALLRYQQLYYCNNNNSNSTNNNTTTVPLDYQIAKNDVRFDVRVRGMPLGKYIHCFHTGHIYQEYTQEIQYILQHPQFARTNIQADMKNNLKNASGASTNNNAVKTKEIIDFPLLKTTLLAYKNIYGNLSIPHSFIIPLNDTRFPLQTRGMKLGIFMEMIENHDNFREHQDELLALGFDYQPQELPFDLMRQALLAYKSIYKHINVPDSYVINSTDIRFPEEFRGKAFGRKVSNMKRLNTYRSHRQELLDMGLPILFIPKPYAILKMALLAFKEIHGHLFITSNYYIRSNTMKYPPEVRGLRLGKYIDCIRTGYFYQEHIPEIQSLGVDLNFTMMERFDTIKQALLVYQQLHGDLFVPEDYTIPSNHHNETLAYPKELWGIRLGQLVYSIRYLNFYEEYHKELVAIGFPYDKSILEFPIVKAALLRYKELYGDWNIPLHFIVSNKDVRFPPEIRGYDLGRRFMKIRNMELYREYASEIHQLGIAYSFQPIAFRLFRKALLQFQHRFGDFTVPELFVIREKDTRFSRDVWGMKLGKHVSCLHHGLIYQEHVQELTEMGFYA